MDVNRVDSEIPPNYSPGPASAPENLGGFGSSHIISSRIDMALRAETMAKRVQQLDLDQIDHNTKALGQLDKEELDRMEGFLKATGTHQFWASKSLLSSIISSLSSMATGSYLYASHVVQGIQLSLSGSLQLFNTLMNYHNGWQTTAKYFAEGDKEKEGKIVAFLPLATNILILALTTYSFLTLPTDYNSLMATLNQLVAYINVALGAVEIVTLYKKSVAERRYVDGQDERFKIIQNNELALQDYEFHDDTTRKTAQEAKKATQQYMQATSRIAAKTGNN